MPIEDFSLRPRLTAPAVVECIDTNRHSSGAVSPSALPIRTICMICAQITNEMVMLAASRIQVRRDGRRTLCHVRQIAMYVCHVTLQIPLYEIGKAFGRDRTTVGHACHVVEDRRDDPAFDEFVAAVERTVGSVFRSSGVLGHE